MKYKCIYCLKEKEKNEFNREHVMSQMMGKYEDNLVLGKYQVCQECNSYFSKELENDISLDSYEGFLRMQHGKANPMSDGNKLRRNHVTVKGASGAIKGLEFIPVVNKANKENISLETVPSIGVLKKDSKEREYVYYKVDKLPFATQEVVDFFKGEDDSIITAGISQEDALPILIEKGYVTEDVIYRETSLQELLDNDVIDTKIVYTEDSRIRRVWAKIIFNYLCYYAGKEYVLDERFNRFRDFIRYGKNADKIIFKKEIGPISTAEIEDPKSHVVGTMIKVENGAWSLYGHITLFGESTYIFRIAELEKINSNYNDKVQVQFIDSNTIPDTRMAVFNNETRKIKEDDSYQIYGMHQIIGG